MCLKRLPEMIPNTLATGEDVPSRAGTWNVALYSYEGNRGALGMETEISQYEPLLRIEHTLVYVSQGRITSAKADPRRQQKTLRVLRPETCAAVYIAQPQRSSGRVSLDLRTGRRRLSANIDGCYQA